MVNLRSREIPGKSEENVEVASPRRRRASSVQAESPKPRTRRLSEKPEEVDAPSTPRSLRKSLRSNSPLVLSKTIRSDPFASSSVGRKTIPAAIVEEVGESPEKAGEITVSEKSDSDKTDAKTISVISPVVRLKDIAGESEESRSASPKEKKIGSVKGKERKISDYFYSGKEDAKTKSVSSPVVSLKDMYARNLSSVDSRESKTNSPNNTRRGSAVKRKKWQVSDFFISENDDAGTDRETSGVHSEDFKSSPASGDSGEGKRRSSLPSKDNSASLVKGIKLSEKSDSGKEDSKVEISPFRSAPKNDPKPGARSPRRSTKSDSDPASASSDNQERKKEEESSHLKGKSPSQVKKSDKQLSRKSDSGRKSIPDENDGEVVSQSPEGQKKSRSEAFFSPQRKHKSLSPDKGTGSHRRSTKSESDPVSASLDNRERKKEEESPTHLKEKSPSPVKKSDEQLSRKSDFGKKESIPDKKEGEVVSLSPEGQKKSRPETDSSPQRKYKSVSPDKGSAKRVSVTSLSEDGTPAESSVTPKSYKTQKESGSDLLSVTDEVSKTDGVSIVGKKDVSPQKEKVDNSSAKKDALQQESSPIKTRSNKSLNKRFDWEVSQLSVGGEEQNLSSMDSHAQGVDENVKSPRSQLKSGSGQSALPSAVTDDFDRKLKSPAQLKANRMSLEKTKDSQRLVISSPKGGDSNDAVKNGGRNGSSTPVSTDRKRDESGSESVPESAGMILPPKEVVESPVQLLQESVAMDLKPLKTLDVKNDGSTSVEMKELPDSKDFSQTPKSSKKSLRKKRKSGSESTLSLEVSDDLDQKLKSPEQLKANLLFLEKTTEPLRLIIANPKDGDSVAAVKNDGRNSSSLKTPESTGRKRQESGSESVPESAGMLIPPPKEVVKSPVQLQESMAVEWEPLKTPDTKNEGNATVGMEDVADTKGESSGKSFKKKSRKRKKKSGSERLSVSSDPQVSSLEKGVNSSILQTADGTSLLKTVTMKDPEQKLGTSKEVSNGFKTPKIPGKKKKTWKRKKSSSENKQVLDGPKAKSEEVSSDKDIRCKATSKKHKQKKNRDAPKIKAPEPVDEIRTKDYSLKIGDSEVTVRRRGGGTIIESRPVFSDDAKYVYVNCGWGVRVFSIETGECVRVFDAYSKDHKVVSCFCWKSCPAALTSEGVFIAWDPRSGKVQQKVRLKVQELVVDGFFFSIGSELILCLVLETKEFTKLRVFSGTTFRNQQHPLNSRKIGHPHSLHRLSVGGNPERPFIAFISSKKKLKIVNLENQDFMKSVSAGKNKYWTCIQCHPTEDTVALGDSIGRVVVYKIARAGDKGHMQLTPSVYHWHTLPVSEIAFTPAGSSMYSGGGELTLVKWNLENPHIRNYLPRLSADIVHIAISPYNQMIAVATVDNGIQIVTPNNRLHCVLQQLSWSVFAGEQEGMFPAGLIYDPRSRGLMLNGRPGHLQLYSPLSETLTYNIDVTMMNYLTQERDKVIVNTHVTHSALTSDGLWLATVETRYEPGLALELKLKFWGYVVDKKRFLLATVIDMPHDGKVRSIKFSPGPTGSASNEDVGSDHEVFLASTGADKKLRLWSKSPIDSIYQKGSTWRCQNACFYRDHHCGPCSFSYDGSLLAVGFSSVLTLWDVDNVVLKQTIARGTDELKFVEFGRDDCCHIVMCATNSNIEAWNLLTLSLVWKAETRAALLAPDPYSCFFAIFTVENQWKILNAHNGEVAYTMNSDGKSDVSDQSAKSQVLAAVFAPRHRPNPDAPQWMRNSYLYYIDIYQELNCLEPANEISQLPTFQLALDKDAGTPFGSLISAKSVKEANDEELTKQAVGYGVLGSQAVTQLLRPPAHTLPSVSLLCGSFLQSFIIMKRDVPQAESDHEDKSEDDKTTVVASSDSESEPKKSAKTGKSKLRKRKQHKKTGMDRKTGAVEKNGLDKKTELDEPMEIETIDLRKHFPPLDEDDAENMFVIDD